HRGVLPQHETGIGDAKRGIGTADGADRVVGGDRERRGREGERAGHEGEFVGGGEQRAETDVDGVEAHARGLRGRGRKGGRAGDDVLQYAAQQAGDGRGKGGIGGAVGATLVVGGVGQHRQAAVGRV